MNDQIPDRREFSVEVTDDGWLLREWIPPDPAASLRARMKGFFESASAQRRDQLSAGEPWKESAPDLAAVVKEAAGEITATQGQHKIEHYTWAQHPQFMVRMGQASSSMAPPVEREKLWAQWEEQERVLVEEIVSRAKEGTTE